MYSESAKKATIKYQKNNLDTIIVRVPKGEKDRIREYAESHGQKLTPFIVRAIREKMERG